MKKIVFALALVLGVLVIPQQVSAQSQAASFQILSFDIGYAPSWDIDNEQMVVPVMFGLNVRVADSLIVGFQTFTAAANADRYLNIKYNILSRLRATLAFGITNIFGNPNLPAVGFGFEAIPFSRNVGGSVTTEFKTAFQYLAPVADIDGGGLVFTLGFGVGF